MRDTSQDAEEGGGGREGAARGGLLKLRQQTTKNGRRVRHVVTYVAKKRETDAIRKGCLDSVEILKSTVTCQLFMIHYLLSVSKKQLIVLHVLKELT